MIAFAIGGVCIVVVSAIILFNFSAADNQPVATASIKPDDRDVGKVLVPNGQGTCDKYTYVNASGKSTYEGTAPCDNDRPKDSRSNLPPALRGMQNSLRSQ